MKEKQLKSAAIWSYAFAQGSGYQIMGAIVGSYLMIFLTDTFGVPAAAVGIIMVIASVWDAINDPMMGTIADRTKTKWGRYRPYLLFVPALLTVVVVALFASPSIGTRGKIIWTAVFYIAYGMLRTAVEIPFGALISAVTKEEKERNRMISAFTLVMGIFTTITTSFALAAVSLLGGANTAKGYRIIMAVAGILMTISCWICVANTEEKYVYEKEKKPLFQEIKELIKLKGLLPIIITWIAAFIAYNVMMSSSVYYILYCQARPDLISLYMLDLSLAGLLGIAIGLPMMMKVLKQSNKAFACSQIIVFVCSILAFLFGKNLLILFLVSGIASFFATMSMAFNSMIMAEMTDYVYYKTGNLMNGTIASLKGFTNKCGIAVANGVVGGVLALTGYVAGAVGGQSEITLAGINSVRFLLPSIMALVIVAALKLYPITNEAKEKMCDLYSIKERMEDNKFEEIK